MNIKKYADRKREILKWSENNKIIITPTQLSKIDMTFEKLLKENRHKNKDSDDLRSLLHGIIERITTNISPTKIFNSLSDNSHMNYFDVFMENQSNIIKQKLKQQGLSTDVLKNKAIKNNVNIDTVEDENGIVIQQDIEENEDNYKVVTDFRIYLNGELIYSYVNELDKIGYEIEKEIKEEIEINVDYIYDILPNNQSRRRYSAGTIINGVKVGGRFV